MIEEYHVLIANMQEKINQQHAKNIQMMKVEPMEYQPCIDIVTRSGATTRDDKANGEKEAKPTWVRKTTEKALAFDILKEKKVVMEVR